ncbi:MAG: hypothetical protein RL404_2891 [Pseudomonadota bacterium]
MPATSLPDVCVHLQQDQPSAWVRRFAPLIPRGRVLDLACGGGRHSRLLAGLGMDVLGVDRDPQALTATSGERIRTLAFDLEQPGCESDPAFPLGAGRYTGIVVTNYLHRPLLPLLLSSLVDGGVLIYETFAQGNGQFGKPSSPAFLLAPGEWLQAVIDHPDRLRLRVLAYEDGYTEQPKPAMVQRICVRHDGAGQASPADSLDLDKR